MQQFTADDLTGIMRSCAGLTESADLSGTDFAADYADLGYDSLAVLEIQAKIQQRFGVRAGDEELERMQTPAATILHVNTMIKAGG